MNQILILGAHGQLARHTTPFLLQRDNVRLTLFLRKAKRLKNPEPVRVTLLEGDVTDRKALISAMRGQDVVYANLAGDLVKQAKCIVEAMHETGVRRLIFISSIGIYGEVPGEKYRSILDPYRESAAVIEGSDLDYTVLRPGWLTSSDQVTYRITRKGEPFIGHDVSLTGLSSLIVDLALSPTLYVQSSLGVSS